MIGLEQVAPSHEPMHTAVPLEDGLPASITGSGSASSPEDQAVLRQVDRILRSEELRGCEVLRRLLKFLAQKSISGEADELKEYVVAIDGLGKPASYDPRHNSAVRIQVGRLRQKLADYYRSEGKDDPVVIDVPKGRFKLKCEYRTNGAQAAERNSISPAAIPDKEMPAGERKTARGWTMRISILAASATIVAIAVGAYYHWMKPVKAKSTTSAPANGWSAEMEDLWNPFLATDRPLIVAIEDPLFVELDGKKGVYFRDKTLNRWRDITASPMVKSLSTALKTHEIEPSRYYTAFGEVDASFQFAKLLGSRVQNMSVVKTSNLSLRELEDNNVLFVGVEDLFFNDPMQATPIQPSLQPVHDGVRDLHPGTNQPSLYIDQYSTAPSEEGVAYALVTHLPGPMGRNDVESFNSSRAAGYVAAVKAFTDPGFGHTLVSKLKASAGGKMPRYYQVLLKVKFKDGVPTEITYVLARELH